MIPRPINRSPATRAARGDMGQRRLESLAAEFALLAQRRSRLAQKSEMLEQQRAAAAAALTKLQARMAWLAKHIDESDPQLRAGVAPNGASSGGAPSAPPRRFKPAAPPETAAPPAKPVTLPAIGRQWLAARSPVAGPAANNAPDQRRTRR